MFTLSTTAFHLSSKPTISGTTIDNAAGLYELPDLGPAIVDYLVHHHPNFTHMIRGRHNQQQIVNYHLSEYKFGTRCRSNFTQATIHRHCCPSRVSIYLHPVQDGHLATMTLLSFLVMATWTGQRMAYKVRLLCMIHCFYCH